MHNAFNDLEQQLNHSLIEREKEVRLTLLGLLASEHVLFVGPPGTGKSLLCNSLVSAIEHSTDFKILLTKFTDPSETCGPIDIPALKAGHNCRVTGGFLPTANLAFFDEVFKASSAILNTLLTAMEERKFQDDGKWISCPLRMLIGASNEYPIGEGFQETGAFFDRFLIRQTVKPVSPAGLERLLFDELPPFPENVLTLDNLDHAAREAQGLGITSDAKEAMIEIVEELRREGIRPGDRRMRKSVKVAKAAAWLDGKLDVERIHLEPLKHCLWEDPRDQPEKTNEIVSRIANPTGFEIQRILREADDAIATVNPTDAADPNTYSGLRKVKDCIDRLAKLHANGRAEKAIDYLKTQVGSIQKKMLMK